MFTLVNVEVYGLWGQVNIRTKFDPGVNIFIGPNGSGKTTFMNILHSILTVDLDLLSTLQFERARLVLKDSGVRRVISAEKIVTDIAYDVVKYRIGNWKRELPLVTRETEYRRLRTHTKFVDDLEETRSKIDSLINISWLSVHREKFDPEYLEYRDYRESRDLRERRATTSANPIDRILLELKRRLTEYQLELQAESNSLSIWLEKEFLSSMLFNPEFDTWASYGDEQIRFPQIKKGLLNAYKNLGILDEEGEIEIKIDEHIDRIKNSYKAVRKYYRKPTKGLLTVDDVLPVSLLRRTQHIVQLSTYVDKEKRRLNSPLDTYLDTLREFAKDKEFNLDPVRAGGLLVNKGSSSLQLDQLSSGEKQLIILLTETLLQKNKRFVFIADEPELSLHIQWQRRILSAIKTLNSKAQIIVATHSPEIASRWRANIINMESITYER